MVSVKTIKEIKNFGTYKDFNWNKLQVKGEFSKVNIFYGQNYSGKTTLSRIFRAFELRKMPSNYGNPEFTIQMNDGKPDITHNNLENHNYVFRVFNQDFVKDNLSFIYQSDGDIKSFSVTVGQNNIAIETKIKELQEQLGENKNEQSTGLYRTKHDLSQSLSVNKLSEKEEFLNKQLSNKATGDKNNSIKYQPQLYGDQNYTVSKLQTDISEVEINPIQLSHDEKDQHKTTVEQKPLAKINNVAMPNLNFDALCLEAKDAIEKDIIQTSTIEILRQNKSLESWAGQGIGLHKNQHDDCAFCGNTITQERWQKLEAHFNQESKNLIQEIKGILQKIEAEEKIISGILNIEQSEFYPKFQGDIQKLMTDCEQIKANYLEQLINLKKQLSDKSQDIFSQKTFNEPTDYSNEIKELRKKYNDLVNQSNEHTNGLSAEIKFSQGVLRLNAVKDFMDIIGYDNLKSEIEKLRQDKTRIKHNIEANKKAISNIRQEIESNKQKLSNEAEGAKKVNEYINHHFGHPELKLQYIDNTGKFTILRNGYDAHNLSEGECNLIAFCYFLAKLHDAKTSGAKPIIWIDDPISSLDDNHIFFIYSLIRAEMVDKNIFEQLFISTHSLNFLKYLMEIKAGKHAIKYFSIAKIKDTSCIKEMPPYLQKYKTELHYLFEQIYNTAFIGQEDDDTKYHIIYNFANNARKFLEIYLLYVYPDDSVETKEKYKNFYDNHRIDYHNIDRFMNEGSHLKLFENAITVFDFSKAKVSAKRVAKEILLLLHAKDEKQVEGFIKSIRKDYEEFKQKLGLCEEQSFVANMNESQKELENAL